MSSSINRAAGAALWFYAGPMQAPARILSSLLYTADAFTGRRMPFLHAWARMVDASTDGIFPMYFCLNFGLHIIGWSTVVPALFHDAAWLQVLLTIWMVQTCLFFLTAYSDPGVVKPEHVQDTPIDMVWKYCETCDISRPLRSKHCPRKACGHCINRFDHHCDWMNVCVGSGNHLYFYLTLVCIVFDTFLSLIALFLHLVHCKESPVLFVSEGSVWASYILFRRWKTIFMIGLTVPLFLFAAKMLKEQTIGILRNMTFNEGLNGRQYTYMRGIWNSWINPFDKGWKENVKEFLGYGEINWYRAPAMTVSLVDAVQRQTQDPMVQAMIAMARRKAEAELRREQGMEVDPSMEELIAPPRVIVNPSEEQQKGEWVTVN